MKAKAMKLLFHDICCPVSLTFDNQVAFHSKYDYFIIIIIIVIT